MSNVQPYSPLVVRPQITPPSKGYAVPVVLLALGVLAGIAYYLFQKHVPLSNKTLKIPDIFKPSPVPLSPEAQKIFDSFKKPPQSLNETDLHDLAKQIEFLRGQRMSPSDRYKVRLLDSFNLQTRKKFILSRGPNNTLRVQYIEKKLGRGGFGKVVQLIDLHDGKQTALKVAKIPKHYHTNDRRHILADLSHLERAQEDLKKEHKNLMIVHTSSTTALGVQDKPLTPVLTISKLYLCTTKRSLGFEGTLYDGSLDKLRITSFTLKVRLLIALQILKGMETLLANKLISHDLKPQNILYRQVENLPKEQNLPLVHISDLGGVTHENDLEKELKKGLAYTPQYADAEQIKTASDSSFGFMQKGRVRTSEKCAVGLTIFWVLTGLDSNEGSDEAILKKAKIPPTREWKALFAALKDNTEKGLLNLALKFFEITSVQGLRKNVEAVIRTIK